MNKIDREMIDLQLVDSRVRHTNLSSPVTHPTLPFEKVYCVYCGRPYGWVTDESYNFIAVTNIIVVCDECELTLGKPPLPEAMVDCQKIGDDQ